MRVRDLIAILQCMPPDAMVMRLDGRHLLDLDEPVLETIVRGDYGRFGNVDAFTGEWKLYADLARDVSNLTRVDETQACIINAGDLIR